MADATTWKIRVSGYGTFDFNGTEEEADDALDCAALTTEKTNG